MKTTNTIIDVSTDRTICSNAGTLLVADTADTLNIADVLDAHLVGLTPDTVTHTAGTVMTSVAVALTAGATCLDDLDLLGAPGRHRPDPCHRLGVHRTPLRFGD